MESSLITMDSSNGFSRPSFYVGENNMECEPGSTTLDALDLADDDNRKIILGICSMAKKSKSQPMREILGRLERFEYIKIVVFDEHVILNEPVENWPICDCLISFYSKGFCLDKAIAYEKLRRPYVLNDLPMQYQLQDRRSVYASLMEYDIDHPRYAVCDQAETEVIEGDDQIEVNGVVFQKPFVEKPLSAEDHNVYIYFPTSAGGGSQRLFRKIGSRSSVYSPVSRVRKAGSYIYEDFMPTDGTDVKIYTLGPEYAHAEARKSPALDGKVERDKNGKEVRYPVILSAKEKMIARMVCLAFKQTICGFDLLRANGKSYVCDVNGFSFVKNSMKYYDDCAKIIGNMVMRHLAPQLSIPWSISCQPEDIPIVPTTYGTMMELRSVIAVIRHGDRTPKQKMKMEAKHQKFFYLFAKYNGYATGQLKLKRPKQLQEVLDISRALLNEQNSSPDPEVEEKKTKLEQLKSVLEMYGHFSGINRKVQLKFQPNGRPKKSSSDEETPREPSLVLILKWGGELTPAGKVQAEELGKAFRCMYPGGEGDYGQPGLGLLRLHSTFRHDLKIYASDEGRVQMTAAAFAKGLLALEGELTPILVQMVKSANTNGLLDNEPVRLSDYQNIAKTKLIDVFHRDREFTVEDFAELAPTSSMSLINAMKFIKNPFAMCARVYELIHDLTERIRMLKSDPEARDVKLYHGETWELMMRRWSKLEKDFKMKSGRFDISKIPDIYDCIKYDLQHNKDSLNFEPGNELHTISKALADIVVPQEYGITESEKLQIALSICTPLLTKIKCDLERNIGEDSTRLDARYSNGVSTPHRHVRTRLYFTSESHIHSLLTLIQHGGLCNVRIDEQWRRAMDYVDAISELNYMTQIVMMMYEDPNKDPSSEERFHLELHFSPGAQTFDTDENYPAGFGYRPQQVTTPRSKSPTTPELNEDSAGELMESDETEPAIDLDTGEDTDLSSSRETLKSPSTDNLLEDDVMAASGSGVKKRSSTTPIAIDRAKSKSRHKSAENLASIVGRATEEPPEASRSQSFEEKTTVNNYENRTSSIMESFKRDVIRNASSDVDVSRWRGVWWERLYDQMWTVHSQHGVRFSSKNASSGSSHEHRCLTAADSSFANGSLKSELQRMRRFSTSAASPNGVIRQAFMDGHQTRLSDLLYLPGLMANHRHSFATLFANNMEVKGSDPPVPAIRPLETLHNALTLKQMEGFIDSLLLKLASEEDDDKSTSYLGRGVRVKHGRCIPLNSAYSLSSSNNSSGGPPSPTTLTEDTSMKLRLLIAETRQHSMEFDPSLISPDMFANIPQFGSRGSSYGLDSASVGSSSNSQPSTPGFSTSSPRIGRSQSQDIEGHMEAHWSDME